MNRDRDRDRRYGDNNRDRDRDRGRERDRDRDYHSSGQTFHTDRPGGESYRPAGAPRPRSPPPFPRSDTYRRRSRSPREDRYSNGRDNFRERSRERRRSPPRFVGRREENNYRPVRSPVRETRYGGRSPRREKTPLSAKRSRDPSPSERRTRSPPAKRERLASPRGRYRSPSPRRGPPPPRNRYEENNYRPRSPSPRRNVPGKDRYSRRSPSPRRDAALESGSTSRRSSPPVHPSRARLVPDNASPRPPASHGAPSPYTSPPRERPSVVASSATPTGPRSTTRAPPTGPSNARSFPSSQATAPSSIPTGGGSGRGGTFVAPSRPRGGGFGGAPRGGSYTGYSRDFAPSGPRRSSEAYTPTAPRGSFSNAPPTGPRNSGGAPPTGPSGFRGNASASGGSTSSTYPRSQRFLNDLPTLVPGGQKSTARPSPAERANSERIKKLEVEADRLRQHIEEVEKGKRSRLREWERLQADVENSRLGSELAGERLRELELEDMKQ